MRHHTSRRRIDPILAPDQFGIARPLQPEDLDTRVTRQGIYPSLPALNGVPWSEYVRVQGNRPSSISSSTEALESDQARYVTRRIVKHARSMAVGTRSLPTDSPIPYFQPIERGYMSKAPKKVCMQLHMWNLQGIQKQIEYQHSQVWMIMTPCLLLDMAEEHWTLFLHLVAKHS